jgi:hypothetical protein
MFTIKDATGIFARIDSVTEEELPTLDKALRNLSQRVYLPPSDRQGRADVFSLATICALRLIQIASTFGMDRWKLEALARATQNQAGGLARRIKLNGGERPMSPVEEAIERVRAGQTFDFNIRLYRDGRLGFDADWPADNAGAAAVADKVLAAVPTEDADVTFTLHASRLIGEIVADFKANA